MQKFSGIDLHSDNSMVVVSDEEDRIVYQRRLPNDLAGIVQALAPFQKELMGVVVEATYNWYFSAKHNESYLGLKANHQN
jgi:transposase